jgi:hypothetical protein
MKDSTSDFMSKLLLVVLNISFEDNFVVKCCDLFLVLYKKGF